MRLGLGLRPGLGSGWSLKLYFAIRDDGDSFEVVRWSVWCVAAIPWLSAEASDDSERCRWSKEDAKNESFREIWSAQESKSLVRV